MAINVGKLFGAVLAEETGAGFFLASAFFCQVFIGCHIHLRLMKILNF